MPKFRLRSYDANPPGNYLYLQTKGIRKEFGPAPDIVALGNEVSQFRKGNNLPRQSVAEAIEDISSYTCFRLGNMPQWCISTEPNVRTLALNTSSPVVAPCPTCGIRVQQ